MQPLNAHSIDLYLSVREPTAGEVERLLAAELATPQRAQAFGITAANGREKLKARSQLLRTVYPEVRQLCETINMSEVQQHLNLWNLWLPLAMQLASAQQALGRPLVQGILGGQGTGKTTLAAVIGLILERMGTSSLAVSLDDLYKTYTERQQLQQQDPRLIWRGPPLTHDVELGVQLLDCLRQPHSQDPILVPRFDKSVDNGAGDRTEPKQVEPPDIVLFEGWFVGVRPVENIVFDNPPPPINTPQERIWARDCNERLQEYLPLWERLDRLLVLYPVDYRLSQQWRREAEQKMMAAGKSGMSNEEVNRFVEYFWRSLHPELFIAPLIHNPEWVDLVVEINGDRTLGKIYCPSEAQH